MSLNIIILLCIFLTSLLLMRIFFLTVIGFYDVHLYILISKGKPGFDYTIRTEFKKNAVALERTDVLMIEHLMRNGKRKLEMIQDPNVSGMGQFVKDKEE